MAEGVSAECLQKRLIFLPFIEAVPFDIQAGIQTERRTGDLVRGGGPGEALGAGALILPPCPLACQCCSGATVLPSRAGGSKAGRGTELSPPLHWFLGLPATRFGFNVPSSLFPAKSLLSGNSG